MIPRHPSRLFKSRRTALLWAAGVLFTAVTTVGFGPSASTENAGAPAPVTDVTGATVNDADLKALEGLLNAG